MFTLRLHARGDLRLHEEDIPIPQDGEALLRVNAVGICGSDLHWFEEGSIGDERVDQPLVLGHEFAATVASGRNEGSRVAVDPAIPCGRCRYCASGNTNFCSHLRFAGHSPQDGALRTFLTWPESRLHSIPDTISDEAGALLEPLGVALHAVDLGKVAAGARVGIFGCGPVGLLIQQVARSRGATVLVAADPIEARREAAGQFGAVALADPSDEDYLERLSEACQPDGLDVAFEASNDSRAVQAAAEAVRPGARVVVTGIPSDDVLLLQASTARRKGLTILLTRRMRETYDRAIDLVERGVVDVQNLVTHRYGLEAFSDAFQTALKRTGRKVIINP